jgi:hypothetical protein
MVRAAVPRVNLWGDICMVSEAVAVAPVEVTESPSGDQLPERAPGKTSSSLGIFL